MQLRCGTVQALNRTILELKYSIANQKAGNIDSLNRTILELKSISTFNYNRIIAALNRTILELKYIISSESIPKSNLLIAPYWN